MSKIAGHDVKVRGHDGKQGGRDVKARGHEERCLRCESWVASVRVLGPAKLSLGNLVHRTNKSWWSLGIFEVQQQ